MKWVRAVARFLSVSLDYYAPVVIILVGALLASSNISSGEYFTGWDNIHAEFNLTAYTRQIVLGSWIEHHGFGAPAAQAHLAEFFRLPLVAVMRLLLPDYLLRPSTIFSLIIIGGLGVYQFLRCYWLEERWEASAIALVSALFYMLHILTLQQVYISFEMFLVQFGLFPWSLIAVHRYVNSQNSKTVFWLLFTQLALAPSAHTPTVFYLGMLLTLMYAYFQMLQTTSTFISLKRVSKLFLLLFFIHSYWIVPNLYYSFTASNYVQESRTNTIFAQESLWSIREAGSYSSMLTGMHYLFAWKDYDFASQEFQLIFDDWLDHLHYPLTSVILHMLGLLSLVGSVIVASSERLGKRRFAFLIFFFFSFSMLYMGSLPVEVIMQWLYSSGTFTEAFRNPFTKLSILYSFLLILFFSSTVEYLIRVMQNYRYRMVFSSFVLAGIGGAIIFSSLPSFRGHFLSEALKVNYPAQYEELFEYMRGVDSKARVLQLPQTTHAGWEYYDWQHLGIGNGYQGMGFYQFGLNQPFLNRDADRWGEASDVFYHELRQALDEMDPIMFRKVLDKYRIDVIIIDTTRIEPMRTIDYNKQFSLAEEIGFVPTWHGDFLTVYKRPQLLRNEMVFSSSVKNVDVRQDRRYADPVYTFSGEYVQTKKGLQFPFVGMLEPEIDSSVWSSDLEWQFVSQLTTQTSGTLFIPALSETNSVVMPVSLSLDDENVSIKFPEYWLLIDENPVKLFGLEPISFTISDFNDPYGLFQIGDYVIVLEQNTTVSPILKMRVGDTSVAFAASRGVDDTSQQAAFQKLEQYETISISADQLIARELQIDEVESLVTVVRFPSHQINVLELPSENCSQSVSGITGTDLNQGSVEYSADRFGVNCAGYDLEYESAAHSYTLKVVGGNSQGRGLKLFVNYDGQDVMPKEYVFHDSVFNKEITLPGASSDLFSRLTLNWETRSFGKEAITILKELTIRPVPLEWFSKFRIQPGDGISIAQSALLVNQFDIFERIYFVDAECEEYCPIVLDTAFDGSWIAFNFSTFSSPEHTRYNGWANAWIIDSRGARLIIFNYLEIISIGLLASVTAWSLVRFVRYLNHK